MIDLRDRFRGCLVGQALGDAVGYQVETAPAASCRDFMMSWYATGKIASYQGGRHPFGQYSDDTQMMRELAETLAEGEFDIAHYAERICRLFAEGRVVGSGRSSRAAAARLAAGVPWENAGEPAPAAGNGAAMRVAPLGLFFDDPETIAALAARQARITHQDPRAASAAVLMAVATALARNLGEDVHVSRFIAALFMHSITHLDAETRVAFVALQKAIDAPLDVALAGISALDMTRDPKWEFISPFALTTTLWALWAFLTGGTDYDRVITLAVAGGGDVDTTAAMAGALAGARLGLSRLPRRDLARLTDQGTMGTDVLIDLADRLLSARPAAL